MSQPPSQSPRSARFHTTRWTMVLAARGGEERAGAEAMQALCSAYWYPLYAFVRRNGHSHEDAQDLTQAFFARLLEKDFLRLADREKGHFRTFLLVALKRFLANEWRKGQAIKRGGGAVPVSFDAGEAERKFAAEPADEVSPEILYDRQWAFTVIERALGRLKGYYAATGRGALYEQFKEFLTAPTREARFTHAATSSGISEGAAHVAIHRMRKRFRQFFREELAETVTEEKVEEELQRLREILSGSR
jgi:DNA-directed RNA polymerase specialized sigma24 family protein